jgi:hypothetical protein
MIFFAIVAAGALSLLLRGLLFGYPPAQLGPGALLSRKEQTLVANVADALFPPHGPIAVSGSEAGLVAYTDQYLRDVPSQTRFLLRLLFVFIEHGPWVFGPSARFTRLTQERRIVALERMAQSPIYFRRVAFLSIRMVMCMGYLANENVKRAIGLQYCIAPFERREDAHGSADAAASGQQVHA